MFAFCGTHNLSIDELKRDKRFYNTYISLLSIKTKNIYWVLINVQKTIDIGSSKF